MSIKDGAEQAIIAAASKTTITGATTAVVSGAAEKSGVTAFLGAYGAEIAAACAIGGFMLALAGFVVSTYFQILRYRRECNTRRGIDG